MQLNDCVMLEMRMAEIMAIQETSGFRFVVEAAERVRNELQEEAEALEQVQGCKDSLEQLLGVRVNSFAYPHGRYNQKTIDIINPHENLIKHPVYRDFFTLVKAKEIYMCPKFSSYVSTASILGDNLIYSFYNEKDTSLTRYNCNCILI